MLKKIINDPVDHLGEEQAEKILKSIPTSSAVAEEDPINRLRELMEHIGRACKIEAAEAGLPPWPEIDELRIRAPAIYSILMTAWEHSHIKSKKELDLLAFSSALKKRITNAISIKSVYKAFDHGANLANPLYKYTHSKSQLRKRKSIDVTNADVTLMQKAAIPDKPLYVLDYCNNDFRKVLYATCRYHGIGEEALPSIESLVDLLIDLGFSDADQEDYASSFITLITGSSYPHAYRHIRNSHN